MNTDTHTFCLSRCRQEIEDQLRWGPSTEWTNQDFEALGEQIFTRTKVRISVSTLKRIWGKVRYDSDPNTATLNALAGFLGYSTWREYKRKMEEQPLPQQATEPSAVSTARQKAKRQLPVANIGKRLAAVSLVVVLFYGLNSWLPRPLDPEKFSFRSRPVTDGLPNSVVFEYNATAAPSDSVFIQQSWDPRRRTHVSRDQQVHTSLYYWPGYFIAKLVVDGQIVKEHDVFIKSEEWLPMVMLKPVPVYFRPEDVKNDSVMRLPVEKITARNIDLQPETPWTHYYNVRNFEGVTTRQFRFETDIKNEYAEGSAACQRVQIVLLTQGGAIVIPLSAKGCISDLLLICIDHGLSGKTADLSGFGVDFSRWVNVVCESKDQHFRFYIDGKQVYEHQVQEKASNVVGIVYRFQGTGAVRNVSLTTGEKAVYEAF